ncbi:hypothetical protein RYH80_12755 [Halobaculum sp. MBLA0147]|uniref:hypothetical protein n=1 Tax=Halobaculum sp. MBLA0147 TaxID=3079934 RepID=UPI00352694F2
MALHDGLAPHGAVRRATLAVLAVALAVATAGCVATPGTAPSDTDTSATATGSPGTDSPTQTPPPDDADTTPDGSPAESPTDTPVAGPATPLPNETVSLPEGPKVAPERPSELTAETVRRYARTFEYRYVYNALWYDEYSDVSADCEVDTVERVDVGWKAVVTCTAYSNTGGPTDGTASPTELHADWFTQSFTYLIDENSTVRREATGAEREG